MISSRQLDSFNREIFDVSVCLGLSAQRVQRWQISDIFISSLSPLNWIFQFNDNSAGLAYCVLPPVASRQRIFLISEIIIVTVTAIREREFQTLTLKTFILRWCELQAITTKFVEKSKKSFNFLKDWLKIQFNPNRASLPTHNYSILEEFKDLGIWSKKNEFKVNIIVKIIL